MLRMRSAFRLRQCERGIATMEFAAIAPFMIMLIVGVFDISKSIILWHQVCNASHNIPLSASTMSVQSDKTSKISPAKVQQAMSTVYAAMPWLRAGIENGLASVTLTAVTFKPTNGCNPTPTIVCNYNAYVVWSVAYNGGAGVGGPGVPSNFQTSVVRPCVVLAQLGPTDPIAAPNTYLTVIRTRNVTQPSPILVADVHYRYTPYFYKFLTGPVDFWETGYWPVRTVNTSLNPVDSYTLYDNGNPADLANCPDTWDTPS